MIFFRICLLSILFFSLIAQGEINNSQPINCIKDAVELHDDLKIPSHALVKEISLEESMLILLEFDLDWRKDTIENIKKNGKDVIYLRKEVSSNIELFFSEQAQCLANYYKKGDHFWEFDMDDMNISQSGIALYRNKYLIAIVFTKLIYKN